MQALIGTVNILLVLVLSPVKLAAFPNSYPIQVELSFYYLSVC